MRATYRTWLAVLAVVVLAAGIVAASDMAFQFKPNLQQGDPMIYHLSLPATNDYSDLRSVYNDIGAACTGAAQVSVFNPDQTSCTWVGPFSCNAPIDPGQGIRVSVVGACQDWVIVGSEQTTTPPPLGAPGRTFALADPSIYDVSIPLHTTALTTADLCDEIPNCASVTKFNPDQTSCTWNGLLSCSSPVVAGESYRVSVSAPATWYPAHY